MTTTRNKLRILMPEFKRQAVALYEASGRKPAAVAAELVVHESVLEDLGKA